MLDLIICTTVAHVMKTGMYLRARGHGTMPQTIDAFVFCGLFLKFLVPLLNEELVEVEPCELASF